jgi:hypothetical protein
MATINMAYVCKFNVFLDRSDSVLIRLGDHSYPASSLQDGRSFRAAAKRLLDRLPDASVVKRR